MVHRHHGTLARYLSSPAALDVEKPSEEDSSRGAVAEQPRPDWTPQSRRTGAIAIKVGMTQLWNDVGEPVPVTVLQVCAGLYERMRLYENGCVRVCVYVCACVRVCVCVCAGVGE